jgi:hypothetical protein
LVQTQIENGKKRIRENDSLVRQIDRLIENYTEKLARDLSGVQGQLILDNGESLNVPALFQLKYELAKDTEQTKLELQMNRDPITIVNFGKPYKVDKPFLLKNIILFPLILIGIFLSITLIQYLDRKTTEQL